MTLLGKGYRNFTWLLLNRC